MQRAIIQRAEIAALIRLIFVYNSSVQFAAPQPRPHRVLMSFRYMRLAVCTRKARSGRAGVSWMYGSGRCRNPV